MDRKNCSVDGMVIVGRIKELLKQSHHTEKEFSDYLGIGIETYKNWKRNKSDSYLHYLKEISEYFNVTPNYLILGEDGLVIADEKKIFTKDEVELISMFRKVGVKEKNYVFVLLKEMVRQ